MLVVAIGLFVTQVRRARVPLGAPLVSGPMSCEQACRIGCQRDFECGGFKGDCGAACKQKCAGNPEPDFVMPERCSARIHAMTCSEADRMGKGELGLLGDECRTR